jgi:hypothetical protein
MLIARMVCSRRVLAFPAVCSDDAVWVWARALHGATQRGEDVYELRRDGANDPSQSDLWWRLRNVSFDGVSGHVAFDANGDRESTSVSLSVGSVMPDGNGGWSTRLVGSFVHGVLSFDAPVVFPGNRTQPPRDTPAAISLLMRMSDANGALLSATWQAITCAALVAVRHVNERNGSARAPHMPHHCSPAMRHLAFDLAKQMFVVYACIICPTVGVVCGVCVS